MCSASDSIEPMRMWFWGAPLLLRVRPSASHFARLAAGGSWIRTRGEPTAVVIDDESSPDSPLEEAGFETSVALAKYVGSFAKGCSQKGWPRTVAPSQRDRYFESLFLQQGVRWELREPRHSDGACPILLTDGRVLAGYRLPQGPHRDHPWLLHGLLQRQARIGGPFWHCGQSSPMRSDVLGYAGRGCWCRVAPLPLKFLAGISKRASTSTPYVLGIGNRSTFLPGRSR